MAKKAKKNWMQGAVKKPGAFTAYCKSKGYGGVTDQCIAEAKAEGGKREKQAVLAETFRKSAKAKRRRK